MISNTRRNKKPRLFDNNENENDDDDDSAGRGCRRTFFIERNGERFQYCLDYMRDGGDIVLPSEISLVEFVQDHGFHDIDMSKITSIGEHHTFETCTRYFYSIEKKWKKDLKHLDDNKWNLCMEKLCLAHARYCLDYYKRHQRLDGIPIDCESSRWEGYYEKKTRYDTECYYRGLEGHTSYTRTFDRFLKRIGLILTDLEVSDVSEKVFVTLEFSNQLMGSQLESYTGLIHALEERMKSLIDDQRNIEMKGDCLTLARYCLSQYV